MTAKTLLTRGRTFFLKIQEGENPFKAIEDIVANLGVKAAKIVGIGGMEWARIGVFSPSEGKYYTMDVEALPGKVIEVISLLGNTIMGPDGRAYTHLHVTLARQQSEVYAGHLVDARVNPFLEVFIEELIGETGELEEMLSHRWGGLPRK
ncbi:MAG: DNA-binding protein [Desulfurococcales archaeon]|nr:DNA-binding protein [Desulfurococcales archaeon]